MYFPYLHDKQSELLALRDYAGQLGSPQAIIPIVEPVNKAAGLLRLYKAFSVSGDRAYVIVNPGLLALRDPQLRDAWQTETKSAFSDTKVFYPTLKLTTGSNLSDVAAFASRYTNRHLGVIVTTTQLSAKSLKTALANANVRVFMTASADRVALLSEFGKSSVVEINDRFPSQRVNADYSGEEWFTRDHLDYSTIHGYAGFSDYTILPAQPVKGGGAPGAVAIHLIYKATDSSFWVQHFVSDETDRDQGTAGSKLLEAIDHLASEATSHPSKFERSPAMNQYLSWASSRETISLGTNKRLEIGHHLFAIARHLGI